MILDKLFLLISILCFYGDLRKYLAGDCNISVSIYINLMCFPFSNIYYFHNVGHLKTTEINNKTHKNKRNNLNGLGFAMNQGAFYFKIYYLMFNVWVPRLSYMQFNSNQRAFIFLIHPNIDIGFHKKSI